MRPLPYLLLFGLLATGCPKAGPPTEGVSVSIRVLDEAGEPVSSAVLRNPDEKLRHPVSTMTGIWVDDRLHMGGNDVVLFEPGMDLVFEISAVGYVSETLHYVVRRKDNFLDVVLTEFTLDDQEEEAEPQIKFGRDVPLDGVPVGEERTPGS